MSSSFSEWWAQLVDVPFVRRVLDVFFSARARLHLVWLDRLRPDRAQAHALLRLVRDGVRTPFGRDHDFARVRSADDFRRLVPLRRSAPILPTDGILALHRRGLRTALALCVVACPRRARLLTQPFVWLGPASLRDTWLPRLVRGIATTHPASEPGCLVGPASRVAPFAASATACIAWRDDLPADAVRSPLLVEAIVRPEGTVAVHDPRHDRFRLLVGHGAYYEFLPAAEIDEPRPTRLTLAEVRPGETYELVVSTPGAYATRTGIGVAFEERLPLFRRVSLPVSRPALPEPATHPRTAGTPAGRPGTAARIPWSAHADRG